MNSCSLLPKGLVLTLLAGFIATQVSLAHAAGGSTAGGGKSGSVDATGASTGKTKTTTTAPSGATALTFSPAAPINGVVPVCAGNYLLSPYYPSLYLLSAHIGISNVSLPDGSSVVYTLNDKNGPIWSNYISILGGSGTVVMSMFCAPSTVVQSVTITDLSGNVISTGL